MSSVNFFGHIVVPKNAYKHVPPEGTMLHISQAALASDCSEGRNSLQVTVDEKTFTLCTLEKGKCENAFLNLNFGVGQEFTLQMVGESPIHITGYYEVILDDDEFDDEDDEDADYIRAYRRALADGQDDMSDEEIDSDEADDMSDEDDARFRMMMEQDFADDEDDEDDEDDFHPTPSVTVEDVTDKKRKGPKAAPPAKKPKLDEAAPAKKGKKEKQPKKEEAKKEEPKKEQAKPQTPAKKGKKEQPKKEEAKTPEQQKQAGTPGSSGKKKNKKKKKQQQ